MLNQNVIEKNKSVFGCCFKSEWSLNYMLLLVKKIIILGSIQFYLILVKCDCVNIVFGQVKTK